jgi:hypothetical protein
LVFSTVSVITYHLHEAQQDVSVCIQNRFRQRLAAIDSNSEDGSISVSRASSDVPIMVKGAAARRSPYFICRSQIRTSSHEIKSDYYITRIKKAKADVRVLREDVKAISKLIKPRREATCICIR